VFGTTVDVEFVVGVEELVAEVVEFVIIEDRRGALGITMCGGSIVVVVT
jgi:hypothetical protein